MKGWQVRMPADNVIAWNIFIPEIRAMKQIQFKIQVLSVALLLLPAICGATCWLSRAPKIIKEVDITVDAQHEFSLHSTSGIIMAKQYRDKTREHIYYGDFGMLRMYTNQQVTVYEGAYMKITPLVHQIQPWISDKYAPHNVLELQVLYGFAFGKRQSNSYDAVGMTYFIAGVDTNNSSKINQGNTIVRQVMSIAKGHRFQLEHYFNPVTPSIANNLYLYEALHSQMEPFLPLASDKPSACKSTLWILQRSLLEIDLGSLNQLKSHLQLGTFMPTQPPSIKVSAAKLRNYNKKEGGPGNTEEMTAAGNSEHQSNSCPQSEEL